MAARALRDAEPAPKASRGGAVRFLTLLLALYAAGAATVLLFRSPDAAKGSGTVAANVTPELQAALDEHARRLRGEIRDDFKKSVQETKDQVNEAVRRLDESRTALQSIVDAGKRSAEGFAKAASTRAELNEDRIKEIDEKTVAAIQRLDGLALQIRELEKRPVGAAPGAPPPAPAPEAPAPPSPAEVPPPAPGPTPEQLAANKSRVRGLITALGDSDLYKALPAATELGRLGDLEAVEPLTKMLTHRDPYARTAAAEALGSLQACDAVPALIAALLDKDPAVFLQAGVALRRILGIDSQLSGDSSRKDRGEARDRAVKYWRENEAAIRQKLGQPAKAAAPEEPAK